MQDGFWSVEQVREINHGESVVSSSLIGECAVIYHECLYLKYMVQDGERLLKCLTRSRMINNTTDTPEISCRQLLWTPRLWLLVFYFLIYHVPNKISVDEYNPVTETEKWYREEHKKIEDLGSKWMWELKINSQDLSHKQCHMYQGWIKVLKQTPNCQNIINYCWNPSKILSILFPCSLLTPKTCF